MNKMLIAVILGLASLSMAVGAPNDRTLEELNREMHSRRHHNRSRLVMDQAAQAWLEQGQAADAAACDAALNEYLADKTVARDARGQFLAAQTAWLRNRPETSVAILEDLIEQHGEENVDGMAIPIHVMGRLMLANIQRYQGLDAARNGYAALLADVETPAIIKCMCHIYLAEIEAGDKSRSDRVLAELEASVEALVTQSTSADAKTTVALYREWTNYQKNLRLKNQSMADAEVAIGPEIVRLFPTIARLHLTYAGLYANSAARDSRLYTIAWLRRVLKLCPPNSIDHNMALYILGLDRLQSNQHAVAETYFRQLYGKSSSFAVFGGIEMVKCQSATAADVKKRFSRIPEVLFGNVTGGSWPSR